MRIRIGEVEALFRYPVKSMAGQALDFVALGWHGLDGDRRLAIHRTDDRSGFPWLTATKVPELILYVPLWREGDGDGSLPTHVRTPERRELPLFGEELSAEIGRRLGSPVGMMYLNRGIFDEASVSLITSTTVGEIAARTARRADVRRFRPNIVIASSREIPFEEDEWVGGLLTFGEESDGAAVSITNRDERCAMVNYDPDSAQSDPAVMKTIVRERGNLAGVYGATLRRGRIEKGQAIYFERA